eukprot:scaffold10241_cov127-Isochrysis_galbana.AAC.5
MPPHFPSLQLGSGAGHEGTGGAAVGLGRARFAGTPAFGRLVRLAAMRGSASIRCARPLPFPAPAGADSGRRRSGCRHCSMVAPARCFGRQPYTASRSGWVSMFSRALRF